MGAHLLGEEIGGEGKTGVLRWRYFPNFWRRLIMWPSATFIVSHWSGQWVAAVQAKPSGTAWEGSGYPGAFEATQAAIRFIEQKARR